VASVALACFITAGATVLVIAAPSRFALIPETPPRRASMAAEHVVYVGERSAPALTAPVRQVSSTRMPALTSSDTMSTRPASVSTSVQDQASPIPPAIMPTADASLADAPATAASVGASAAGLTVGFSSHPPSRIRYDSALGAVQDKLAATIETSRGGRPSLTQSERDEQMRAESRDAIAARGAGTPNAPGAMAAGGIAVPLPFGGPSNAQRERDRRAYEDTKRMMARVQRRADSVVAARRRRFADSLAQVADSQVRRPRPR
jgi:hypothetical protein